MAALWQTLREEWKATVSDFQEKGAVAVFQDAALDAVDIVKETGGYVADTAASLLADKGDQQLVLTVPAVPAAGSQYPLTLHDGVTTIVVEVMAVDSISEPPKAKVQWMETGDELTVTVDTDGELKGKMTEQREHWLLSGLRQEVEGTIEEFRSKGAIGALKDATLDAVDILHEGVVTAGSGAKSVAGKAIDFLGTGEEESEAFNPEMHEMYENPMLASEMSSKLQTHSLEASETLPEVVKQRVVQPDAEVFSLDTPCASPEKIRGSPVKSETSTSKGASPVAAVSEEELID